MPRRMNALDEPVMSSVPGLELATWLVSTLAASAAFWLTFGACVDVPQPREVPQARVVASWDPLACGRPHRVVIELEDEAGAPLTLSAPCALGGLTIDAPHFGIYRGRIYAWELGEAIRSIVPVELAIDEPLIRWMVETPR